MLKTILALVVLIPASLVAAEPKLTRSDFVKGLDDPWDMAFLPDGTMFFTEKCKGLSVRLPDGTRRRLFGTGGSTLVAKDLFCEGQSGMNGVALDPDFTKNHWLYVYMPSNAGKIKANHVVRLTVSKDLAKVSDRKDIVTDIAYKNADNAWGGAGSHSGGRIRFGADGFLYVSTGDNHNGTIPQDLRSLGGKVLRVTRDGSAAQGNKPPKDGDKRIFTYGHRNVQGLCFDPKTQQPYAAEHGPNHDDEVTALVNGKNGGWDPKPEPGVSCDDNYCGYTSNKRDGRPTPMSDGTKFPDTMRPLFAASDSEGMGPCEFLSGAEWKDWNGAMLVGYLAGSRVEVVRLKDGAVSSRSKMDLPSTRFRSLVLGPDKALYVTTDNGNIWRVVPK